MIRVPRTGFEPVMMAYEAIALTKLGDLGIVAGAGFEPATSRL